MAVHLLSAKQTCLPLSVAVRTRAHAPRLTAAVSQLLSVTLLFYGLQSDSSMDLEISVRPSDNFCQSQADFGKLFYLTSDKSRLTAVNDLVDMRI